MCSVSWEAEGSEALTCIGCCSLGIFINLTWKKREWGEAGTAVGASRGGGMMGRSCGPGVGQRSSFPPLLRHDYGPMDPYSILVAAGPPPASMSSKAVCLWQEPSGLSRELPASSSQRRGPAVVTCQLAGARHCVSPRGRAVPLAAE